MEIFLKTNIIYFRGTVASRVPHGFDLWLQKSANLDRPKKFRLQRQLFSFMESQGDSSKLLEPWNDLRGKVVLVTGASSGLGREFCLDLALAGCRIVAAARRVDRLQSLCDEINNLIPNFPDSSDSMIEPRAVSVELDVTADGSTIQRSVQMAWDAFGRIDALINNAGMRGIASHFVQFFLVVWICFSC